MNTTGKHLLVLILTLATAAFVLSGCQTTKGFGRDVENLGDNIQGK